MSEAISKAKLLEWMDDKQNNSSAFHTLERVFGPMRREIRSGTFDLSDVDVVGELDSYHRMMHERNERLEKELLAAKAKIAVLERDNDMLESAFSGKEAEVERLIWWQNNIQADIELHDETLRRKSKQLNQAVEALEEIRTGTFGEGMYVAVAEEALQSIKGAI